MERGREGEKEGGEKKKRKKKRIKKTYLNLAEMETVPKEEDKRS